jgi:hypothetical protein
MVRARSESSVVSAQGVHPPASFATVLRQERSRVQRFGGCFSLLSIVLSGHSAESAWLETFIASVHRRLRAMDAFGWVDAETLGVVLPVTGLDGAWTVARDLERIAKGTGVPLRCAVTRFPEQQDAEKNKPDRNRASARANGAAGRPAGGRTG